MAGHIGNIAVFQPEAKSMPAYLERMDLFLIANDIAADKRVPVFLSLVGGATYGLLRNLCSLAKPQDKSYTELTSLLTQHYEPEPLIIAERFHFHRRDQAADESISVYIAELRRLATTCKFDKAFLDESLRDRFVCGLKSEAIQRRLLSEEKLLLKKAVETALAMESAEKNTKSLKPSLDSAGIQKLYRDRHNAKSSPCYRCGRKDHDSQDCQFRTARCYHCGKTGHIASVCRSAPRKSEPSYTGPTKRPQPRAARQNYVPEETVSSDDSEDTIAVNRFL